MFWTTKNKGCMNQNVFMPHKIYLSSSTIIYILFGTSHFWFQAMNFFITLVARNEISNFLSFIYFFAIPNKRKLKNPIISEIYDFWLFLILWNFLIKTWIKREFENRCIWSILNGSILRTIWNELMALSCSCISDWTERRQFGKWCKE